jgi:serine/threonine protein kinase
MNFYARSSELPELLPESAQVCGARGIYQIIQLHGRRGLGRMYQAERVPEGQPVTVREYVLPTAFFNQAERHKRIQLFNDVAGIKLADGRDQDIRLIAPREAIADPTQNRCYLISEGNIDTFPTLSDYLSIYGSLGETAVRECLNQILQTLECLHGQSYLLPSGHIQHGLVHGHMSLSSCILYPRSGESALPKTGDAATQFRASIEAGAFMVYLCDLALWEAPFAPVTAPSASQSPGNDLQTLGELAFSLLTGDRPNPSPGEALNPRHPTAT